MRRMGSVKTRKVSTQSLQSTTSAEDTALSTIVNLDDTAAAAAAAAATGPDALCDEGQDTQTDLRDTSDEVDYCRNMPWIKVLTFVSDYKEFDRSRVYNWLLHLPGPAPYWGLHLAGSAPNDDQRPGI